MEIIQEDSNINPIMTDVAFKDWFFIIWFRFQFFSNGLQQGVVIQSPLGLFHEKLAIVNSVGGFFLYVSFFMFER